MVKLQWNTKIDKAFSAGVRNVILFEPNGKAHPWSGVKKISESVSERSATPYYMDGFKYHNQISPLIKNFSIEVFTYPDVLDSYLGISNFNGLIVEGQTERRFNLVYLTDNYNKNGELTSTNINILYNVMAIPEDTSNDTLDGNLTAPTMNFKLDVIPVIFSNILPSYKITISQLDSSETRWNTVIDVLFGTKSTNSFLPSISKFRDWFIGSKFDFDQASRAGYNKINLSADGAMIFGSPLDGYYIPSSAFTATKSNGYYTIG